MPAPWLILTAIAIYLVVLLAVGWRGDRIAMLPRHEQVRPVLHGLSLATLCSAWTYFGAVGDASKGSWLFVANAIGPIIAITAGYPVWRRIAVLAKQENVGSLADFLAARYGKSRSLGIVATMVAALGALPYIALQLAILTKALRFVGVASGRDQLTAASLIVVLAGIAILFGARRPSLTQHNRGFVAMLAFESVVKLTGLLIVAGLVVLVFAHAAGGWTRAWSAIPPVLPSLNGSFATFVMLCTVTAFTLPRQFHLAFVAIEKVDDSRTAARIVPAYFALWMMATLLIAVAVRAGYDVGGQDPALAVLSVPGRHGHALVALLALLGGLSAGAAMVVVELTAISAMVSNEIVLPFMTRAIGGAAKETNAGRSIVHVRRWTVLGMAALSLCYFIGIHGLSEPTELGLTALTAFAQLIPSLIGGLYWRRAHARGAIAGIVAGMILWAFAIAGPAFVIGHAHAAPSLWLSPNWATEWAVWASLALNGLLYVTVSLATGPRLIDTIQANSFVAVGRDASPTPGRAIKATVRDLRTLLTQFLGASEADKGLRDFAAAAGHRILHDEDPISPSLARSAERLLAGVIGAPSARNVVAIALAVDSQDAAEISQIIDEASHAVHFNRELLQTTLDSLAQGVSVFDQELALVAWNSAFLRFLALTPDEAHVGKPFAALLQRDGGSDPFGWLHAHLRPRLDTFRSGETIDIEMVNERGILRLAGRRLPGGDYLLTLADVTDLRAAEQVLARSKAELEHLVEARTAQLVAANQALAEAKQIAEQATRAQRRLVAAASHDLVQPLHAARLFLGNALVGADEAQSSTGLLRKADQAVEGAHRLLRALLSLSQLEIGALTPALAPINAGSLLASLAEEFVAQAETRGLELAVLPTHYWVRSDPDLLRSMLQNLVQNALRYTLRGRVVLLARRRGATVRIEVRDSGVGIASDKLPRAFAEFSRLDEGELLASGTGLGLSIVARIAHVLGHDVAVRSAPGWGSIFSVTVPAAAPVRAAIAQPPRMVDLAGLRILCVDDERDVLSGTGALLTRWGAEVALAASYAEASALGGSWDVILADYHLGQGDGLSLLREMAPRARVRLLITATPEPGWASTLDREHIQLLTKPLAPLELQALLASAVARDQPAADRSRASS